MNIVDVISEQLSGHMGRLSSLLGENENTTRSAVGAAAPTLLMALSSLTKNSEGAQKLSSVLNGLDSPNVNPNQPSSIISSGTKLISSLFGGDGISTVTNALCSYTGLGSGMMKNLIGYIAPLMLGAIGSQFKGKPIDSQGVMKFFNDQKANIASAMPAGLSLPEAGAATAVAYGSEIPVHEHEHEHEEHASRWLAPLAALAILCGLFLWWNNRTPSPAPAPAPVTVVNPQPKPEVVVPQVKPEPAPIETAAGSIDFIKVGDQLTSTYSSLGDTLATVKDGPTAEAALPALKLISTKADDMKGMLDKMPASARATLATATSEHLSKLTSQVSGLLSNPAISSVLKPVLDHLVSTLTALGEKS